MALAPEREIFLRTGGRVRFLRISTRVQLAAASVLMMALGGWGVATGAMLWSQAHMSSERAALEQQRTAVVNREARVDAYRSQVSDIAKDIVDRQRALERIMSVNLGTDPGDDAAAEQKAGDAKAAPQSGPAARSGKVSAASPEESRLLKLRAMQVDFEQRLATAAKARLAKVETAIRSFGLNPAMLISRRAQGGPFIPVTGLIETDKELRDLALLLGKLNAMETSLATIPSSRPTASPIQTSSYGYRRDPFNGRTAFHSGIDFHGRYGQTIQAAASGRVSFVGLRAGYGKVVEIDHGNGIMTRYAHLSRFSARVGDKVTRGQAIARMGSTGRSTGTHLHFEVRVRGQAVNPRRFLEARQDVLEIQQTAKQRLVRGNRG